MLTPLIVAFFVVGYLFITLEDVIKVNKAAVALLMCVACWVLYTLGAAEYVPMFYANELKTSGEAVMDFVTSHILREHLGEISETLFFLMGAMTVVEIIDTNGGFNFVREALRSKTKRSLLWKIAFITFFLSAVLDNLTTTIVMVMVLRKLVYNHEDRLYYAGLIVIAANAGGAFSPIGDVTTIMLWIKGSVTAVGVMKEIFLASLAAMVVPAFGQWLNEVSGGNHYLVTGVIGVASSIVDNVPLVAGCMNMYPIEAAGDFAQDGVFWQLLAYCAGVGGSMLIIGSAAGVVAMGLEKISFGWYLKKITWVAAVGYFAGIFIYWFERAVIHM